MTTAARPLTADQALWMNGQLLDEGKRWDVLHGLVKDRRLHFDNDPSKDPDMGDPSAPDNPFKDVTKYQSGAALRIFQELLPRLTENQATVTVSAPKDTQGAESVGDDIAGIFNTWIDDIQEEYGGKKLQHFLGTGQIRDCFRVMEWSLRDTAWGPEGVSQAYLSGTLPVKRAESGCPWVVEFPDVTTCAIVWDRHRKLGPKYYARRYKVSLLDYLEAGGSTSLSDTTNNVMITEAMSAEPTPGDPNEGISGGTDSTPSSSSDWGRGVTVKCLWTRTHYFEWLDDVLVKTFEHKQSRIRVTICPALDTDDPDPARRWLPALEGVYRGKPFVDRLMTVTGALAELGAQPVTYLHRTGTGLTNPTEPLISPDGSPGGNRENSALSGVLPPGVEYGQVKTADPNAIQPFLQWHLEQAEKDYPSTGQAEISSTSAPWTARLAQQQASAFPKMLSGIQDAVLAEMLNDWLDTHAKPVDQGGFGEDISAYSYSKEDGKVDRSKVLTVPWKSLKGYRASVSTNPLSSAEQTTNSQVQAQFYAQGLITEEDLYEAFGKANPSQYAIKVMAERVGRPFVEAKVKQLAAAVLGSDIVVGLNGQGIGLGGQPVDPRADLMARGWKPQAQGMPATAQGPGIAGPAPAALPGGAAAAVTSPAAQPLAGQQTMPAGGPLAAPGTLPIGGT